MAESDRLFREERLQLIARRVLERRKVFVADLVDELGVSPSSIRNDLTELESRGLLSRTYGGAIVPEKTRDHWVVAKSPLRKREDALRPQKDAIGRAAAALIRDGEAVAIDGGSTTLYVAAHLKAKRMLSVVTNSYALVRDLMAVEGVQLHLTGGLLSTVSETLVGDIALHALDRFRVAKAVLGVDGLSLTAGLTSVDPDVAAAKRKMIAISEQVIVVCDHTKFNQVCLMPVATLDEVDYIVTDDGVPLDLMEEIRRQGPQVIVAPAS